MNDTERQQAVDRLSKAKKEDNQLSDMMVTESNVNLHVSKLRLFNHNRTADFMLAMFQVIHDNRR